MRERERERERESYVPKNQNIDSIFPKYVLTVLNLILCSPNASMGLNLDVMVTGVSGTFGFYCHLCHAHRPGHWKVEINKKIVRT